MTLVKRGDVYEGANDRGKAIGGQLATVVLLNPDGSDFYNPVVASGLTGAGINAAIEEAMDRGDGLGGLVVIPNLGSLWNIEEPILLPTGIELAGHGRPQLRLADGVNAPIIMSEGFVAGAGVAHENIRIRGLKLDCNKAGQTSGHGVAVNCRDLLIDDLYILNPKEHGLYTDYRGSTSPHAGRVEHLFVGGAGKHGWYNDLSDLHADDINIRAAGSDAVSTYDGIYCASSAGNMRASNINIWSSEVANFMRYALNLAGDGNTITNLHAESGALANLMIDGSHNKVSGLLSYNAQGDQNVIIAGNYNNLSGSMYPGFVAGTKGVQIGVTAGDTAANNQIDILADGISGGAINSLNSGGGNLIRVRATNSTVVTGTRHSGDTYDVWSNAAEVGFTKRPTKFTAVAGAGTTTANATVLAMDWVTVSFAADTAGVRLSSDWTVTGHEVTIVNGSAVAGKVYPHSAGNFQGLSQDVAVVIPAGATMICKRAAALGWSYILT